MNQRNLWPDAIVSDAKSSMDNLDLENLRERFLWNRAGASFVMFFCDVVLVSSHGTANPELTLNLAEEFAFLTFPGMLSGTDSESKRLSAEAKCRGQITMDLSENRVYSQTNSHLIGIMISKTIGQKGVHYFQTHPILAMDVWSIGI